MSSGTAVRRRLLPSPYTPEELASFRSLLAHRSHEILESCRSLSASPVPESDYLGRVQAELREISAALERIDTLHFGRCEDCGDAIPAERLWDVPATPACAGCTWKSAEAS